MLLVTALVLAIVMVVVLVMVLAVMMVMMMAAAQAQTQRDDQGKQQFHGSTPFAMVGKRIECHDCIHFRHHTRVTLT